MHYTRDDIDGAALHEPFEHERDTAIASIREYVSATRSVPPEWMVFFIRGSFVRRLKHAKEQPLHRSSGERTCYTHLSRVPEHPVLCCASWGCPGRCGRASKSDHGRIWNRHCP